MSYPNTTTQTVADSSSVEDAFLINTFAAPLTSAELAVMATFTAQASSGQVVTGATHLGIWRNFCQEVGLSSFCSQLRGVWLLLSTPSWCRQRHL